jgi:AcrR family transcriptional regulator
VKQRETEIIEAAIALFQRDGYKNVTMSDIAAETNISKGAVYLYFSSKEVLMTAIQAHLLESLKQYYVKLLEKDIS